jgi:hypothetical protein
MYRFHLTPRYVRFRDSALEPAVPPSTAGSRRRRSASAFGSVSNIMMILQGCINIMNLIIRFIQIFGYTNFNLFSILP